MPGRLEDKWRPRLALVLGGTLAVVLGLPLGGIVAVRALSPGLGFGTSVLIVGLAVVAATVALGWLLWRLLYGPIVTLAGRARMAKMGEAGAFDPVRHYGTAELRGLGRAMLDMGRVLQGREAVLRSYADHVTHELKSPLTVLRGAAELLEAPDLPEAERARLLSRIDMSAARMTLLLDAQRALARAQEPFAAGETLLAPLLREVAQEYPDLQLSLVRDCALPLAPDGMRLVLQHLVGNAADQGAGRVWFTADPGRLVITDDGPGISEGNRDRVFEPFFTTGRERGGTGMGLSIVRKMLEAHEATIRLGPNDPGASFVIAFREGDAGRRSPRRGRDVAPPAVP